MTAQHSDSGTATLTVDGVRTAVRPILDRLAASAAARDYAVADVRALADAGIALTGIARDDGGAGRTLREVADPPTTGLFQGKETH